MTIELPSLEVLDKYFTYDPETGSLTNNRSRGAAKAGSEAGGYSGRYRSVCIDGTRYLVHRICYAMHYRVDPGDQNVDHIDRDTTNNRASNLRLVDQHINSQNCERTENASHCYAIRTKKGVRYRSRFTYKRKVYWCGTFDTPEEARASAIAKKESL